MSAQRRRLKAVRNRKHVHDLGICGGCRHCPPVSFAELLRPGVQAVNYRGRVA